MSIPEASSGVNLNFQSSVKSSVTRVDSGEQAKTITRMKQRRIRLAVKTIFIIGR
jgi:hypothetical protein